MNETEDQRKAREQEEADKKWVVDNTGYQSSSEVPTEAELLAHNSEGDDTYSTQD